MSVFKQKTGSIEANQQKDQNIYIVFFIISLPIFMKKGAFELIFDLGTMIGQLMLFVLVSLVVIGIIFLFNRSFTSRRYRKEIKINEINYIQELEKRVKRLEDEMEKLREPK